MRSYKEQFALPQDMIKAQSIYENETTIQDIFQILKSLQSNLNQ